MYVCMHVTVHTIACMCSEDTYGSQTCWQMYLFDELSPKLSLCSETGSHICSGWPHSPVGALVILKRILPLSLW